MTIGKIDRSQPLSDPSPKGQDEKKKHKPDEGTADAFEEVLDEAIKKGDQDPKEDKK